MKDKEIFKEIQNLSKDFRDYHDKLKSEFNSAYQEISLKISKLPTHQDFSGHKGSLSKNIEDIKDNISKLYSRVNGIEGSLKNLNIKNEKEFTHDVKDIVKDFTSSEEGQSLIFKTVAKEQTEKEKGHLHKKTYWKEIVIPILGLLFLGGSVWSYILPKEGSNSPSNTQVVQQLQGGK